MALLELNYIGKSYRDGKDHTNHVLHDLCLEVKNHEFIAIKGASGSGKTTLLSILGLLISPDSGVYEICGEELDECDEMDSILRNVKFGFVFQDSRLLPQLTALQNILLPTLALEYEASKEETAYAKELMELTNISHVAKRHPNTLSGGEACRVALCRALIKKPVVLLADEPTGQLDRENALAVGVLLKKINSELGTTIIMVTHSDEVAKIADRVLTLNEGKLV